MNGKITKTGLMVGYSRRRFLKRYVLRVASVFGTGLMVLSCNIKKGDVEKDPSVKALDDCDDLSGVSENDLNARKKLAYVNESPIPDATCSKCNLFLPPQGDKKCGGCMLFKGPVYVSGYCTYWTAKQG